MFRKFLNPKNDIAFKRIFGTEKNKDILVGDAQFSVLKKQLEVSYQRGQFSEHRFNFQIRMLWKAKYLRCTLSR